MKVYVVIEDEHEPQPIGVFYSREKAILFARKTTFEEVHPKRAEFERARGTIADVYGDDDLFDFRIYAFELNKGDEVSEYI